MMNFIATLPVRFLVAVILGGIGTGIVVFFINALIMPFQKKKALEDAIKEGRVITAKRTKYVRPKGSEARLSENYIWGYYSYDYGNKTRKFRLQFITIPPETVTLYYKKNPAKAKTLNSFGLMESGIGEIFFIMTLICFVFSIFFM